MRSGTDLRFGREPSAAPSAVAQRRIASSRARDAAATFSPDGQSKAFVRELGSRREIHVMNVDSRGVRLLNEAPAIDFEPQKVLVHALERRSPVSPSTVPR